ncbi:hypothetical protein [Halopiger djelfimassiliensis]|uniref:hypothetical protein n=1 Tax=Halopiger djelfimassiliensis TaxID=1293047 RepID=UPI000677EC97|nr:hypothetical protein [Halopiger djelfimassiliensis]
MTRAADTDPVSLSIDGTTLRANDIASNCVSFDLVGWDRLATPHEFDEPIDATIVGRVSEIRYDMRNLVDISRLDGSLDPDGGTETTRFAESNITGEDNERLALPDGEYACRFDSALFVRLRFDGEATIRNQPCGPLTISFRHPTRVTFGFKSPVDYPRHELTVEPSPDGVATALSHLTASIETTTADRVHRNYRGYPPLIEFGSETRIPEPVREATPETGIELVVPSRLSALFPVAPLAYYLGARLRTGDVETPVLRASRVGLRYEFDGSDRLATEAISLLRRAFFLDLLSSWADPGKPTVREYERLEAVGIDLENWVDRPLAERIDHYLGLPTATVDEILPEWPYRMAVTPSIDHVSVLPHLLYDIAAITVPSEHDGRSSSQSSECPGPGRSDSTATDPLSTCRWIRGRLGDGELEAPSDGTRGSSTYATFTALPSAYENRLSDLEQRSDEREITVVFAADRVPESGRTTVVDRYARRSDVVSPAVERIDDPTRAELAEAFADGADFLHYVGDCDGSGLACRDGYLTPATLDENDVGLFQLDSPRSGAVATDLIETGSIAGVVGADLPSTVDGSVSTTIGELVLDGQSLATAHACASDGTNGAGGRVVGDGTHRFVAKWKPSPVHTLSTDADGNVRAITVPFPVDPVGGHWRGSRPERKRLLPAMITYEVAQDELDEFISGASIPIYYDGRFYWPETQKQLIYPVS